MERKQISARNGGWGGGGECLLMGSVFFLG